MPLTSILIIIILLLIAVVLLAIRILLVKGGKFPSMHISGDKHMRDKGIGCVQSQDREARKKSNNKINLKDI